MIPYSNGLAISASAYVKKKNNSSFIIGPPRESSIAVSSLDMSTGWPSSESPINESPLSK